MENNVKIISKFDYYTAVWQNSTLNDVFKFYKLDNLFDDSIKDLYRRSQGYMEHVVLSLNGIQFSFSYDEYLNYSPRVDCAEIDLFDYKFSLIRADFPGQALDHIRSLHGDDFVNSFILLDPSSNNLPYHVTRCDIAYDFLNYMPEFLECCVNHLSDCRHSYLTRVPIMNTQGGNKYSVRIGDQTTIYLGATTSDKLLRIYDKKAQYTKDGLWKENNPYMDNDDCKSWFRIELQTRQKKARSILYADLQDTFDDYSKNFFISTLRYIYDNYCFRDLNSHRNHPKPVSFWVDLWNWEEVPSLIQNSNVVEYSITPPDQQIKNRVKNCLKYLALFVDMFGFGSLEAMIRDYITYLNQTDFDTERDKYIHDRIKNSFIQKKLSITDKSKYLIVKDNKFYFNFEV